MPRRKNPKDSKDPTPQYGNWAKRPPVVTQKSIAEGELKKVNEYRKGRVYQLVPHPTIPKTFLEREVQNG